MKMSRYKILYWLIIGTFILSAHACVIEEPVAALGELLFHSSHHSDHEHPAHGHQPATHDHHDENQQELDYCCSNILNLITHNRCPISFQSSEHLPAHTLLFADKFISEPTPISINFSGFGEFLSLRNRDNYALSCLLHAPPAA